MCARCLIVYRRASLIHSGWFSDGASLSQARMRSCVCHSRWEMLTIDRWWTTMRWCCPSLINYVLIISLQRLHAVSGNTVDSFSRFLARDVIYNTSRAYATMSVSVCLSVTEVHWRIIANLGFKFLSRFTAHCGRGACGREHWTIYYRPSSVGAREGIIAGKSGGIISRYASHS